MVRSGDYWYHMGSLIEVGNKKPLEVGRWSQAGAETGGNLAVKVAAGRGRREGGGSKLSRKTGQLFIFVGTWSLGCHPPMPRRLSCASSWRGWWANWRRNRKRFNLQLRLKCPQEILLQDFHLIIVVPIRLGMMHHLAAQAPSKKTHICYFCFQKKFSFLNISSFIHVYH